MRTRVYLWIESQSVIAMLSLLLLLPPVLAQGEAPVACLQSGACFQVTLNLRVSSTDFLCRAHMATPHLDASMLPTRAFGMQSPQQEVKGADKDNVHTHVFIQVCCSSAAPSSGGALGRIC